MYKVRFCYPIFHLPFTAKHHMKYKQRVYVQSINVQIQDKKPEIPWRQRAGLQCVPILFQHTAKPTYPVDQFIRNPRKEIWILIC